MALALQPSPKTLSAQPQAPHRPTTRANQPSRYLHLGRAGLAAFTRDTAVDQTWSAVLEHDRLLHEHRWFAWASSSRDFEVRREHNALIESGRPQQIDAALEQRRSQLGVVLRESLGRLAALTHPNDRCLRGDAETAFVALAGRLGPTLPT